MITTDDYVIRFKHENLHKILNSLENTNLLGDRSATSLAMVMLDLLGQNLNGRTYCIIEDHNKNVLFEGVSECSSKDQFCKDVGRKYALRRAIQDLDREERVKIWKAYLNG